MNKLFPKTVLTQDLDFILSQTTSLWENLREKRIFITGGTGFFGCWLVESFLWANNKLNLNATACLLTRNKANFHKKYPHLAQSPAISFLEGDITNFKFPKHKFSHIIHAATDTANSNYSNALSSWATIVEGTKHILEFAKYCESDQILFTSSGAVYGKQPPELSHIPENYPCQPDLNSLASTYAVGKCAAEHLCLLYAKLYNLDIKIARCFAFVGPYLSLSSNFAIANFIHHGLKNEDIIINGDGTPYRSYLYAADLAIWLWTILFKGKTAHPYNVGSNEALSIQEVAQAVAKEFDCKPQIKIMKAADGKPSERYVPNIQRAYDELGLSPQINLEQAIQSTIKWHTYFGHSYAS